MSYLPLLSSVLFPSHRLVKSAEKTFKEAERSDDLGDEERAYILFMKYFNVLTIVKTKADYKKQVKTNLETQEVINQVVGFITSHNYKDFPTVVALVEDATDQLGFAKDARAKSEAAAAKKDWNNAMLWANQWWQYQVKAADLGLRAKTYLEEHGAKKVK